MKTIHVLALVVAFAFSASLAQAGPDKLPVKAGESMFVCGCGQKCCEMVSMKAGKCHCGHELTKVAVNKVEGNTAHYTHEGKSQTIKIAGGYKCGCSGTCCQMISQKAGKCACGKDMVKAKAEPAEKSKN